MGQRLAELFIDITMRGGAKAQLTALRDQIKAMDKSLDNGASLYRRQTAAKLDQMEKIAERSTKLSKIDQETYSGDRYKQYANKQAKADAEDTLAMNEKSIANSKAELKVLNSRKGPQLAEKQFQADRIKKQVDELRNQQLMIAQHGKLGAAARRAFGGVGGMQLIRNLAPGAILGGTMGKMASDASPAHIETVTQSFNLLSAEIGTVLLPAFKDLAYIVQQAAGGIRDIKSLVPDWLMEAGRKASPLGMISWAISNIRRTITGVDDKQQPDLPATKKASIEDLGSTWDRIQTEAASRGPLEERLYQIQVQQLEQLRRINGQQQLPAGNQA